MAVKVPPLLHKMSTSAQKAWYKKHGMEMPAKEKSAATAGKMKASEPKKTEPAAVSNKPKTAREINIERQKAYYAKGGRAPIGAGGGGGYGAMAGVGQSSAKEIIKGIKAGINPKVALVRYTNEEVEQVAEGRMKDIVTDRQETERLKAQDVLGGPVKEKPKMPPGKQPAGYRYVRGLARRAMKAGLKNEATSFPRGGGVINYNPKTEKSEKDGTAKLYDPETERMQKKLAASKMSPSQVMKKMKEEVEQVFEQDDTMEKKEMAQTQLHFIGYAAKEILEFIDMGGEIEEWYQNKLSKVQSEVESLHSYIEGEKRRTGMVKEEVEVVDEKINLVKAKMGDVIKDFKKSDAPQFKGKSMEKRRQMAVAAKLGAEREAGMREEAEQVTEAEGTVATTPKEKALAAHHGDPKKITYGDVIKARLKSAAAKKMGK
jgi:hypothetical protein